MYNCIELIEKEERVSDEIIPTGSELEELNFQ